MKVKSEELDLTRNEIDKIFEPLKFDKSFHIHEFKVFTLQLCKKISDSIGGRFKIFNKAGGGTC